MRVLVMVKGTKKSEAGMFPSAELLEAMGRYNQELMAAGILQDAAGIKPTSQGVRVAFSGKNRTVAKGPFGGDPSDILSGFWIWEVKSLDEAIDWVKRCPNPMPGDSIIEVRPFYSAEDFQDIVKNLK